MTFLPWAADAFVPEAKVRRYILNPDHPENGGKAILFGSFGFVDDAWAELIAALRRHPMDNAVAQSTETRHGTKFVVRCRLATPDGRDPCRTTVWIIVPGDNRPRLVTAC